MNMTTSKEETIKISKVSKRAVEINPNLDHLNTMMHLNDTLLNDTPLDFDRMLKESDSNLMHDIYGINRHLDRDSGKLMDCFVPRLKKRS